MAGGDDGALDQASRRAEPRRRRHRLRRRHDLVVAAGEQKDGYLHVARTDGAAERGECPIRNAVLAVNPVHHLKVIGAGQVHGLVMPAHEALVQFLIGGRFRRKTSLQHQAGVGSAAPEAQNMRALHNAAAAFDQRLECRLRRAANQLRQAGLHGHIDRRARELGLI